MATLINGVASDLLSQNGFSAPDAPELVDLAVVATGLGMVRSNIGLVKRTSVFWDSTQWELIHRPFLDVQSLAYANALAAWVRDDADAEWTKDLVGEVKRPMRRSLKYLQKTDDSFFSSLPQAKSFEPVSKRMVGVGGQRIAVESNHCDSSFGKLMANGTSDRNR